MSTYVVICLTVDLYVVNKIISAFIRYYRELWAHYLIRLQNFYICDVHNHNITLIMFYNNHTKLHKQFN